jgi:hypothetical protein
VNERIKDLWAQAEEELEQDFETGKLPLDIPRYWNDLMQEKFAQLIVKECLSKIEVEAAQYHEPVWAYELVNDIKDHFGVK